MVKLNVILLFSYFLGIRQLQCILLKAALIFGVEVHNNVTFKNLIEPPEDQSKESK